MTEGILLSAAFAMGLFGSTHCLAMCGAIVLLFEAQEDPGREGLSRRLSYNLGRMMFYVILGIVAGTSGELLMSGFANGLMILRLLAGILIVLLGINLLFDWQSLRFLEVAGARIWKRLSPLGRDVLPIRSNRQALAAGILWGALPCGLVYSAVALAATSGGTAVGGMVMLAFWLGTLPALLLAGASADKLHRWKSQRTFRRPAGVVMILFGLISLALPLLHAVRDGNAHYASAATQGQADYL